MQNEISTKFLLSVFEKCRQHGERKDHAYHLEGVMAFTKKLQTIDTTY